MGVGGRVGSVGGAGYENYFSGKSTTDFNEEIVWTCIGMATLIAILISLALLYIVYEKCQKKREYFINA
uniref:CSON008478 protein n=1 Tax=Culicoides sonorensis TaxID=179676 RepID=A0A336LBZ7_CULSO